MQYQWYISADLRQVARGEKSHQAAKRPGHQAGNTGYIDKNTLNGKSNYSKNQLLN